ncbi:MAG: CheR family methyltransferase, partial [Parvularcula sp.]|nr:CheR family methyltransferase [Parvularcula sp.]
LTIEKRKLYLAPFTEPRGRRRPIDTFFCSLAKDQGPNAACIVLSGTGADGSEGLRAIKAHGGLTVAQDPSGARYAGMPSSAMTTGVVDLVLPAEAMPEAITRYFFDGELPSIHDLSGNTTLLETAIQVLRTRTSHDFSQYKRSTLLRRIARRMQVLGVESESQYAERLRGDDMEAARLFSDILINVTAFFRDPEAFNVLRETIVPRLFQNRSSDEKVRVWVPGCSSGEEAYSIGMLLLEEAAKHEERPRVEIFATDIDPMMLARARHAVYHASAYKEVPPELADRYLVPDENGFRIADRLRDIVRVSSHNLIKDPPFSRMDLISCRNLLIYLEPALQKRLFPLFHYALKPGSYLFLGPSENVPSDFGLFELTNTGQKIYRRRSVKASHADLLPLPPSTMTSEREREAPTAQTNGYDDKRVRDIVSARYILPHIVVNGEGAILFVSRDTSRYLAFPGGSPNLKVAELAKPGLRAALLPLVEQLAAGGPMRRRMRDVVIEDEFDDDRIVFDIVGERVSDDNFLIVFLERWTGAAHAPEEQSQTISYDERLRTLQLELSQTEQDLRTTVEELETSNEELKSSNEEMMSMNEELQSANEELTTVNDELQDKIEELAKANADKANYLQATQVASVFLDDKLQIREVTPQAERMFDLSQRDIGRNLRSVNFAFSNRELVSILETVSQEGGAVERKILTDADECFLVRGLSYRTLDGDKDGFVLIFVDITEQQGVLARLAKANADYQRQFEEVKEIYRAAPQAMALFDLDHCVLRVNERFAEWTGFPAEQHEGKPLLQVFPGLAKIAKLDFAEVAETGQPVHKVETIALAGSGERIFDIDWYPVKEGDTVVSIGLTMRDITDQQRLEDDLRRVMRELQHRVKNMLANVTALVSQAQRSSAPPEEKLLILSKRIKSLAQTHDILTETDWKETPLTALINAELVNVYGPERVSLSGPDIKLGARATLAFAMAFHEMATNASKYGALSVENGVVKLEWWVIDRGQGPFLQFEWKEEGGPAAKAPSRVGFGTGLITSSVEKTLSGEIKRAYDEDGFSCEMRIPLGELYTDRDREHSGTESFKDPFS